jgi:hypothetical protein
MPVSDDPESENLDDKALMADIFDDENLEEWN